jgi:hypothetical protein
MDQAGRVAFWRYAEWAGHQLAEAHQGFFLKRRRGKTHCCEFFEAAGAIAEAQAHMDKACRPRSTDATLGARIAYLVGISCRDLARFPCVVQRPTGRLALRVIPRRPVRHREAAGAVAQTWAVAPVKPVLSFPKAPTIFDQRLPENE